MAKKGEADEYSVQKNIDDSPNEENVTPNEENREEAVEERVQKNIRGAPNEENVMPNEQNREEVPGLITESQNTITDIGAQASNSSIRSVNRSDNPYYRAHKLLDSQGYVPELLHKKFPLNLDIKTNSSAMGLMPVPGSGSVPMQKSKGLSRDLNAMPNMESQEQELVGQKEKLQQQCHSHVKRKLNQNFVSNISTGIHHLGPSSLSMQHNMSNPLHPNAVENTTMVRRPNKYGSLFGVERLEKQLLEYELDKQPQQLQQEQELLEQKRKMQQQQEQLHQLDMKLQQWGQGHYEQHRQYNIRPYQMNQSSASNVSRGICHPASSSFSMLQNMGNPLHPNAIVNTGVASMSRAIDHVSHGFEEERWKKQRQEHQQQIQPQQWWQNQQQELQLPQQHLQPQQARQQSQQGLQPKQQPENIILINEYQQQQQQLRQQQKLIVLQQQNFGAYQMNKFSTGILDPRSLPVEIRQNTSRPLQFTTMANTTVASIPGQQQQPQAFQQPQHHLQPQQRRDPDGPINMGTLAETIGPFTLGEYIHLQREFMAHRISPDAFLERARQIFAGYPHLIPAIEAMVKEYR